MNLGRIIGFRLFIPIFGSIFQFKEMCNTTYHNDSYITIVISYISYGEVTYDYNY